MNFECPVCGEIIPYDLKVIMPHTEKHIVDVIKKRNPNWVEDDGICKKCFVYYKEQMRGTK